MQRYSVKVTKQALEHLNCIWDYFSYELLEPDAARRILKMLRTRIGQLSKMPYRVRPIEELPWRDMGFRKICVKNYYVYFWVNENKKEVEVIGIIYARRDQASQLRNLHSN